MSVLHYFHAKTGMKHTIIGHRSIKNPHLWKRLHNGGSLTLDKADDVMEWLAGQGYHVNPEGEPYHAEAKKQPRGEEDQGRKESHAPCQQEKGEE